MLTSLLYLQYSPGLHWLVELQLAPDDNPWQVPSEQVTPSKSMHLVEVHFAPGKDWIELRNESDLGLQILSEGELGL